MSDGRPLRFGFFTTFYPPFNFGGDGVDVERTARALVARGHAVTVLHDVDAYQWLSGRTLPAQAVDQNGVEVLGLRSRLGVASPLLVHQLGRPVAHRGTMRRLIRDRRFDVVVFHNASLIGGPGLLSLGEEALRVYVAHEHWLVCPTHVLWRFNREPCDARACTQCVLSYRRPPQLWRYTGALERQVNRVDVFIARSEFSRRKHQEFGFQPPMQVLPYFLPGPYPPAPEPRSAHRPHERPYFLFVGRLERIKGLDSVIPAFRHHPDADLVVIGDGDEGAALREQAAGVPNVHFLGRVPNEQLAPYYQHAIATIVPSRGYETFGIVLIEAFRHGTPVIARRLGPFPEIVEASGGGALFSNDDELLGAMRRLQDDRAFRDACAASAFAECGRRWSEQVVIDGFLRIVRDALETKRSAAPGGAEPRP